MPFGVVDVADVGVVLPGVEEPEEGSVDGLRPEIAPTGGFLVAVDMVEGLKGLLLSGNIQECCQSLW